MNGEGRTLDLRPELRNLAQPTLLIVGEMDPIIPRALALEIVHAAPSGLVEFVEVPGAGHQLSRDAPDVFVDAIRRFVERTWRSFPSP